MQRNTADEAITRSDPSHQFRRSTQPNTLQHSHSASFAARFFRQA